ncbi:phosphonate ABC transporter substrate-binding protein [Candidatus Poribacteria bacterium]|nr:phosphonate ABC transporter substrate-binding protein [Candidatus Poribacteria bacterium]
MKHKFSVKGQLNFVLSIVFVTAFLIISLYSYSLAVEDPKEIRFGLIPTESSTQITDRWEPLLDHIAKTMNIKIKPYSASDYAGIIEAMRFGKIEAAYFGPKSYVEASERSNAWAIAREKMLDGSEGYHSIIITKKGSGLKTFEDIKDKTFAFNDPNSTSGYLVPMTYFLRDEEIVPEEYFSKVIFSGSHEASIMTVKLGKVDAASTNDLDLDRQIQSGRLSLGEFNIIWKSDTIPGSPLVVRGDLSYGFVMKLQKIITTYSDPKGLEQLQLAGFVKAIDEDYDPIRAMREVKDRLRKQN